MNVKEYCTKNNLPDFISTWQEVEELTGKTEQQINEEENGQTQVKENVKFRVKQINQTLEQQIAQAIAPFMTVKQPEINKDEVIKLIKEYAPVKHIEVKTATATGTIEPEPVQHEMFEEVLKLIGAGINLYLYGPAGTGKTQIAETAATALNKQFYCISVCAQSTKSDLLGFINANGIYVKSLFRECFETGGVFLIDEIDNGNPNILAVLNAALANGYCAFPDGMIKRHEDFICIAAANTFGTGADRIMVGRNQLDGATLNRFMQVEINYDEKLEVKLYGNIANEVQAIRKKFKGERVIVSMRNIANAAKLEAIGYTRKEAIQKAVINTIPENLQTRL